MGCNPDCRKANGRQCHCASCHRTFTGVTTFDDHRQGGKCVVTPDVSDRDGLWGRWGSRHGKTWWSA